MRFSKRLVVPVGFTIFLIVIRMVMTWELTYVFLAWNLFLAWVPFAFSQRLGTTKTTWKIILVTGLWLLFFPNAPYIITDLLHLKERPPAPYWFDVLLIFSAALNGLLLGLASLLKVEQFYAGRYGKRSAGFLILCSLFLCAFGVYMGRYLRWNSWDIITNPFGVAADILDRILNPFDHFLTWSITTLFGTFLYVIYYSIKNFISNKSNQS